MTNLSHEDGNVLLQSLVVLVYRFLNRILIVVSPALLHQLCYLSQVIRVSVCYVVKSSERLLRRGLLHDYSVQILVQIRIHPEKAWFNYIVICTPVK